MEIIIIGIGVFIIVTIAFIKHSKKYYHFDVKCFSKSYNAIFERKIKPISSVLKISFLVIALAVLLVTITYRILKDNQIHEEVMKAKLQFTPIHSNYKDTPQSNSVQSEDPKSLWVRAMGILYSQYGIYLSSSGLTLSVYIPYSLMDSFDFNDTMMAWGKVGGNTINICDSNGKYLKRIIIPSKFIENH